MEPAQTPLPPPTNLPFQPASGIHTSKRISESAVGRIVPAIRQNAGSAAKFVDGPTGPPPAAGSLSAPAGTSAASVMVVLGSFSSWESAAQDVAACAGVATRKADPAANSNR